MSIATEPRLVQQLEGQPWEIEGYLKVGGYEAWKRCVSGWKAEDIVAELKKAGLRGRGGAGFPTGVKWDKVLNHRVKERYFVCNAGEHEPGTFKDRHLLRSIPHQLIEGCLIAAHTVQAKAAFIYVNHEYEDERNNLKKALEQAKAKGFLGKNILGTGYDLELQVFDGYGSYVAPRRARAAQRFRSASTARTSRRSGSTGASSSSPASASRRRSWRRRPRSSTSSRTTSAGWATSVATCGPSFAFAS